MSPGNAKELQQMMRIVVVAGHRVNAARSPASTSAARPVPPSRTRRRKPYAWFISFAPVDDPKVAVAVVVEDADIPRQDISGGGWPHRSPGP